jgi:hypothetical protein
VNTLHDDYDRGRTLIILARQQGIREPLIASGPFSVRQGIVRLQLIIDNDDVATPAG